MTKEKKLNLYLAMLKYGVEMLDKGQPVTSVKIIKHLEAQGFLFDSLFKRDLFSAYSTEVFNRNFNSINHDMSQKAGTIVMEISYVEANDQFAIKPEAYQNYIDYLALQEARRFSKGANHWALAALVVNIVALCVSICFSYFEITGSSRIDNQQFDLLLERLSRETIQ